MGSKRGYHKDDVMKPNNSQLKAALVSYLGGFNSKPTTQEVEKFKKLLPKLEGAFYVEGSKEDFKKFGCYMLVAWGRLDYQLIYSYELVDKYLGESDEPFYETAAKILIIYHPRKTMPNKQLENMINHTLTLRERKGLVTVIMAEELLPKVKEDLNVVRLSGSIEDTPEVF